MAEPSFFNLRDILKTQSESNSTAPFTVGEGLKTLSTRPAFQPLFKNYVLAKNSQSIQKSNATSPRAIMFGETAKLIVSFNADKSWPGGHSLETVEYDDVNNQISYREIIFKDEIDPSTLKQFPNGNLKANTQVLQDQFKLSADDIEFENKKIAATIANPNKCAVCHGFDFGLIHYRWDAYQEWPGIYGEHDDKLTADELTSLATFKDKGFPKDKNVAPHDRYRYLKGNNLEHFPYGVAGDPRAETLQERPNLRLTGFLAIRQSRYLAKNISDALGNTLTPQFVKKMSCMPDFDQFVTQQLGQDVNTWMAVDNKTVTSDGPDPKRYRVGFTALFNGVGGTDLSSFVQQEFYRLNSHQPLLSAANLAANRQALVQSVGFTASETTMQFLLNASNFTESDLSAPEKRCAP